MIIDETAGSGGDLLPWMFRKFKLGPLVGKRTWGGLVGILGFPSLMDGGGDHRAEPRDLDAGGRLGRRERGRAARHRGRADAGRRHRGRDPQLEKAIEVALDELKKNPPARPSGRLTRS